MTSLRFADALTNGIKSNDFSFSRPARTLPANGGGASDVEVVRANGHDSTQPAQLPPREVPANDNVAAPIPLAGDASDVEVVGANGHDRTQPAQLPTRGVPANDNLPKVPMLSDGEAAFAQIPKAEAQPAVLGVAAEGLGLAPRDFISQIDIIVHGSTVSTNALGSPA